MQNDLRKLAREAEHFELPIFADALNDAADRIERMTKRLTKDEIAAIVEALVFRLAGEIEDDGQPQEHYKSALAKMQTRR